MNFAVIQWVMGVLLMLFSTTMLPPMIVSLIYDDGSIHVSVFGRDSEEKSRALGVLKALHAREIHYWGSWAVEDVPST